MDNKILFITADDGLGNHLECVGVYLDLVKHFGRVDIFVSDGNWLRFWRRVAKHCNARLYSKDFPVDYEKIYAVRNIRGTTNVLRTKTQSEVKDNEQLLHSLGITPTYDGLPWCAIRGGGDIETSEVIIGNGSKPQYKWMKKRYRRWNEVAEQLKAKGVTVGCIGLPNEYIHPCTDWTGIGLLETMDKIDSCRVFAGNCSAWAHFACLVKKPSVVVVTATNAEKNFDKDFHSTATVITPNLDCHPCQGRPKDWWRIDGKFQTCDDWVCCNMPPEPIVKTILENLK